MIKIFTNRKDFDHYRNSLTTQKIGLVPTMGNLHKGHVSLIEKSTEENDVTFVSIFVNPKQFGPNEDFDKYPRTLDEDLAKISAVAILISPKKEIVVYAPKNIEGIYPEGFSSVISVGESMTQKLEGSVRPTHFDGVTTVVFRLFSIIKPHIAYFGQKDVQQCLIIKKMVADLELPVEIQIMPIVRNAEGLALSSRNQYLSDSERVDAMILPHTLIKVEKLIRTKQDYKTFVDEALKDKRWDYLEVLDSHNLEAPTDKTTELVIVAAFRAGTTRLLDNILVTPGK